MALHFVHCVVCLKFDVPHFPQFQSPEFILLLAMPEDWLLLFLAWTVPTKAEELRDSDSFSLWKKSTAFKSN